MKYDKALLLSNIYIYIYIYRGNKAFKNFALFRYSEMT